MSIILPEGVPNRWQQSIQHDSYMQWLSFRTYLRGLSRLASADNSLSIASDLLFLSDIAGQRARDLEPVRDEVAA